jgi:hypothetical protein
MYLSPKNLGLAGGIVHGIWMFLLTVLSSGTGYAHHALGVLQDAYPGFTLTFGGSLLILVYGFVEAFIGFFLIAWLYNRFSGSCSCCATDKEHPEHKEWK